MFRQNHALRCIRQQRHCAVQEQKPGNAAHRTRSPHTSSFLKRHAVLWYFFVSGVPFVRALAKLRFQPRPQIAMQRQLLGCAPIFALRKDTAHTQPTRMPFRMHNLRHFNNPLYKHERFVDSQQVQLIPIVPMHPRFKRLLESRVNPPLPLLKYDIMQHYDTSSSDMMP